MQHSFRTPDFVPVTGKCKCVLSPGYPGSASVVDILLSHWLLFTKSFIKLIATGTVTVLMPFSGLVGLGHLVDG